jgi:hypothetical protein
MSDKRLSNDDNTMQSRYPRRGLRIALIAAATVVVFIIVGLLNHNYCVVSQTRSEFESSLDRSLKSAIAYLDSRRMELVQYDANAALTYMIRDMTKLIDEKRLETLVEGYANKYPNYYWLQMVYSEAGKPLDFQVEDLPRSDIGTLSDDQRWFYYVLGGNGITLEDEELDQLMSPTDCVARKLTHQLFALNLLQHRKPDDEELKQLRKTLCERIAKEAKGDIRVCDLLYQRIAFLLMAGREDLIKPRWVEQLIQFQHSDGGWPYVYRPLVVEAIFGEQPASEHASVQAAWVLCQLKYRYPEWIARHYSD